MLPFLILYQRRLIRINNPWDVNPMNYRYDYQIAQCSGLLDQNSMNCSAVSQAA